MEEVKHFYEEGRAKEAVLIIYYTCQLEDKHQFNAFRYMLPYASTYGCCDMHFGTDTHTIKFYSLFSYLPR